MGDELAGLLDGAGQALVVDLGLQAAVEDLLNAQRKDVVEAGLRGDEALLVKGVEQILHLTLAVSFRGVHVTDEAHGLTAVAAELGLGLPDFLHVLQAVAGTNRVLFLDAVGLPRVGGRVVLWSREFWFTHDASPFLTSCAGHPASGRNGRWSDRADRGPSGGWRDAHRGRP